jgi:hypothetical protein
MSACQQRSIQVMDEIDLKTRQQQWMEYLADLKLILNSTHKEGEYVLKRKAPWILFLTNFVQKIWEKPWKAPLCTPHIRTQSKGVGQGQWEGELISMDI